MENPKNTVEALIGILRSPMAKLHGWSFDAYTTAQHGLMILRDF